MAHRPPQPLLPATALKLDAWKARPDVRGVIHIGSRSRGHGDALSDDDLEVVLDEAAHAALAPQDCSEVRIEGEGDARRIIWDAEFLPLSDLHRKATSHLDLDHWPYEQAPVLFDRDGHSVRDAVAALGPMPVAFRHARLENGVVDAYICVRRAAKTEKRGHRAACRLLAGRAMRALTRVMFALEGRWAPLDHWFEHELATLDDASGAGAKLMEGILAGSHVPLLDALERLTPALAAEGIATDPAGRTALFLTLVHPARAREREIHGVF